MNDKTPTPRTDAALQSTATTSAIYVFADFARELERELNTERFAHGRTRVEREAWRKSFGEQAIECDTLKLWLEQMDNKLHACKAAATNAAVSVYYREGGTFDSEAARAVRVLYKNFLTAQASCVLRMLEADKARDELRILKAADYEALTGCADYGLLKLKLEGGAGGAAGKCDGARA